MTQDYAPILRAKKQKKELIKNILGGIILAVGGYIMVVLISYF